MKEFVETLSQYCTYAGIMPKTDENGYVNLKEIFLQAKEFGMMTNEEYKEIISCLI